jgi:hypothetical protein
MRMGDLQLEQLEYLLINLIEHSIFLLELPDSLRYTLILPNSQHISCLMQNELDFAFDWRFGEVDCQRLAF